MNLPAPQRRVRVLIVGPELLGAAGGVQTHIHSFLKAFTDHPVVDLKFFANTAGLYTREARYKKALRVFRLVVPFLRAASESDVIHLNCSFGIRPLIRDSIYAAIAMALVRRPVIIQFHGGLATDIAALRWSVVRAAITGVLTRMEKILVLSRTQADALAAVLPGLNVTFVSNYVDVETDAEPAAIDGPIRFLFLARIDESKGVREAFAAARSLLERGFELELVICGDGPDVGWLEAVLAELDDPGRIVFRGRVDGAEKSAVLRSCHVLLLPTRHREGLPYGVLEAFSHHMPVIATDAGGLASVVEQGVDGFILTEPIAESLLDRMKYLIERPDEIRRMGQHARDKALKCYSFDELRRQFTRLYVEAACD